MKFQGITALLILSLISATLSLPITFVNQNERPIYVGFDKGQYANWGGGCSPPFQPGTTCVVDVSSGAGSSRFCPSYDGVQNCDVAQDLHLTLIETNFDSNNNVWIDISVIPSACSPEAWVANQCANTGGASYNIPVSVSCPGVDTFVCQGSAGNNGYPTNCGTSNGGCIGQGGNGNCNQAYFYPNPNLEPVFVCSSATVTFLSDSNSGGGGGGSPPPSATVSGGISWQSGGSGVNWAMACDFQGGDIGSVQTPGEGCSSACGSYGGCTHFSWTDFNGGTCWMKGGSGFSAIQSSNPSIVCGYFTADAAVIDASTDLNSNAGSNGTPTYVIVLVVGCCFVILLMVSILVLRMTRSNARSVEKF